MVSLKKFLNPMFMLGCITIGGLVGYYIRPFGPASPPRVVNFQKVEFTGKIVTVLGSNPGYETPNDCTVVPSYFSIRPVVKNNQQILWNLGEASSVRCDDKNTEIRLKNSLEYSQQMSVGLVIDSEIEWKRKINKLKDETYKAWSVKKEAEQYSIRSK